MRALVLIAFGCAFLAFALGYFELDGEQPPLFFNIVFGLFGALSIYGGLHHLRFRFRRMLARSGGRERDGTLQLREPLTEDSATAFVVFATSYGQWLLMIEPDIYRAIDRGQTGEPIRARAAMGEDDRIYDLAVGSRAIKLQSEGLPLEGRLLRQIEAAEQRFARYEAKHGPKPSKGVT